MLILDRVGWLLCPIGEAQSRTGASSRKQVSVEPGSNAETGDVLLGALGALLKLLPMLSVIDPATKPVIELETSRIMVLPTVAASGNEP